MWRDLGGVRHGQVMWSYGKVQSVGSEVDEEEVVW